MLTFTGCAVKIHLYVDEGEDWRGKKCLFYVYTDIKCSVCDVVRSNECFDHGNGVQGQRFLIGILCRTDPRSQIIFAIVFKDTHIVLRIRYSSPDRYISSLVEIESISEKNH